jgi:hypothetical protein
MLDPEYGIYPVPQNCGLGVGALETTPPLLAGRAALIQAAMI